MYTNQLTGVIAGSIITRRPPFFSTRAASEKNTWPFDVMQDIQQDDVGDASVLKRQCLCVRDGVKPRCGQNVDGHNVINSLSEVSGTRTDVKDRTWNTGFKHKAMIIIVYFPGRRLTLPSRPMRQQPRVFHGLRTP